MSTRPSVLVVSPYPPTPPFSGGRRRSMEFIAALREVVFVTLGSVVFNREDELALVKHFGSSCDLLMGRPTADDRPSDLPLAFGWAWSSELAQQIGYRHRKAPFGVAIAMHSFSFPFIAPLQGARKVLDAHNLEFRVHAQFAELPVGDRDRLRILAGSGGDGYGESDAMELRTFEQVMWSMADIVLCVSEAERREVASAPGNPRALLVPNASVSPRHVSNSYGPQAAVISFAGALNYIPNVDAVVALTEEVAPLVRGLIPGVGLLIAGREPTRALVQHCTSRSASVVADPKDMFATLAGTVMAVPLRMGAGTRIKVLEARSHGLPVVASPMAVEGLKAQDDDRGLVVSDGPEAMARDLVDRLLSPDRSVTALVRSPTWREVLLPALAEIGADV